VYRYAKAVGAIAAGLRALAFLIAAPSPDVGSQYDRAASSYRGFRRGWLRVAGGAAERAMLAELERALRPRARVLDAGCGTGAIARAVCALEPDAEIAMLDRSPAMLSRAADVPGIRHLGSVLELPFADGSFDVVVAAWVLETLPDRERALAELLRVLTPGGTLLLSFSTLPSGRAARTLSAPLRYAVGRWFDGSFLPADELTRIGYPTAALRSFRAGLVALASYRRPPKGRHRTAATAPAATRDTRFCSESLPELRVDNSRGAGQRIHRHV
jgi:ubiquinone/menaquinone biosynthesis C-methylase UbiE